MKDPSDEIVTAIVGVLQGKLSSGSIKYPVFGYQPQQGGKHVVIENLILNDNSCKGKNITRANMEIQIVTDGAVKKATWDPAADISNQIMVLLAGKTFTMTSFSVSVKPYLDTTYMVKEERPGSRKFIKIIRFNMTIQEK